MQKIHDLIQKLQFCYSDKTDINQLPSPLSDSLKIISAFFERKTTNKLCLVYPSKELAAQWLSLPLSFLQIEADFDQNENDIYESYKGFKPGDKLLLNNLAVVQWVCFKEIEKKGVKKKVGVFRSKSTKRSLSLEIAIPFEKIIQLQRTNKKILSSQDKVTDALPKQIISPLEKLLDLKTFGNQEFMRNRICLLTKYKYFDDSFSEIKINNATLQDYFKVGRIDENGTVDLNSPLLLSNNLSNIALYSIANPIKKIIIDGISAIQERLSDFSDIDANNIPTILITDLSEIESFETIGNYDFEFFNFTKENLQPYNSSYFSPFHSFNKKLENYFSFNVVKEICQDIELEATIKKIHSIEKDESNNDLTTLKISLIQLTNFVSRIAHIPTTGDISVFNSKINSIENLFSQSKMWIGDSHKPIEESITLLKSIIEKFATQPSEKCVRLKTLINAKHYDFIICSTEDEAQVLDDSLRTYTQRPRVITLADVNNNLISNKPLKAILTGWAKSNNLNRILSSFLFSELTVLFYQFENKYYNSLQRRNHQYSENIKTTINSKGIRYETDSSKQKGFSDFYSDDEVIEVTSERSFNILDFELKLDSSQYSKYAAKDTLFDSIKAKRIDFENNFFIYSSESHKFLVINKLIENQGEKANLQRKRLDTLQPGDVVTLINTDRDILAELVDKNTNQQDLIAVKQWTELWKTLLKEYFISIGNDFKKLVEEFRKNDCKKHELTIRAWIQDENRIGPQDDSDLISIALMTNSKELFENISKVRDAISKMVGWRMQASDFISNQIKSQIHKIIHESLINSKIDVEGLGSLTVLKVNNIVNIWEDIDTRYVNRLLEKETI